MAGGTHVFDMIKRLRDNDNLRKKDYFKKSRESYRRTSKAINIDYRTATEDERQLIRSEVIKDRKRDSRKSILILVASVLVTGLLILLILSFW